MSGGPQWPFWQDPGTHHNQHWSQSQKEQKPRQAHQHRRGRRERGQRRREVGPEIRIQKKKRAESWTRNWKTRGTTRSTRRNGVDCSTQRQRANQCVMPLQKVRHQIPVRGNARTQGHIGVNTVWEVTRTRIAQRSRAKVLEKERENRGVAPVWATSLQRRKASRR